MFYPFQKDHRHTTPPSDFHLPRPQLAIIENFECNQVFTFYVFVREYIKKECCQPGHYPYILGGCNPFRALWQRTIDCFSKVTDRAENSALRPPRQYNNGGVKVCALLVTVCTERLRF